MGRVGRRIFLIAIGALFAAPLAAEAQPAATRTIGYLSPRSSDVDTDLLVAFRKDLTEAAFAQSPPDIISPLRHGLATPECAAHTKGNG